jgi:hypothetical protein
LADPPDGRRHPRRLQELAAYKFLAEVLGNFQGLPKTTVKPRAGIRELEEFNDFPPLSIGSLYFEILGEYDKSQLY